MLANVGKAKSIVRLIRRSFRGYSRVFFGLIVLGFLAGLFEGVGIASVIPLFTVMTGGVVEGADAISQFILKFFALVGVPLTPPFVLTFIVVLFILKSAVLFTVRYASARIVSSFEQRTRWTLLRRMFGARWPFLARQKSGTLETVLLLDVQQAASNLTTLTNMVILGTTFVAYTVVALTISVNITIATLVIGALIFLAMKPVLFRIRRQQGEASVAQKEMSHEVAEHMASIKSIKAMAVEALAQTNLFRLFARLRNTKVQTAYLRQSSLAFIEPIGFIVIAFLFLLSYQQTGFSIVSFAVIMFLVQRMFTYVSALSSQLQVLNELYPYLRVVTDWRRRTLRSAEVDLGELPYPSAGDISLESVSFSHRKDAPVLSELSLVIPHGQLLGVVGASGVGKTTLADLLLRLLEPQTGRITMAGTDIRDIKLHEWRRHISYVPQDGILLDASVTENIRFYSDATNDEIRAAAEAANVHEVIEALSEGYATEVGQRGVTLSGGQRQRIILARALARGPKLLILDEATSAVDAESEQLIQDAIARLRGSTTVLVITHRAATASFLDRLVVLDNGRVVEDGTPDALMNRADSQVARMLGTAQ